MNKLDQIKTDATNHTNSVHETHNKLLCTCNRMSSILWNSATNMEYINRLNPFKADEVAKQRNTEPWI